MDRACGHGWVDSSLEGAATACSQRVPSDVDRRKVNSDQGLCHQKLS